MVGSQIRTDSGGIKVKVFLYNPLVNFLKLNIRPHLNPKNSPLGSQKVKNDPKIKSKSNFRIKGNIENESCSTT